MVTTIVLVILILLLVFALRDQLDNRVLLGAGAAVGLWACLPCGTEQSYQGGGGGIEYEGRWLDIDKDEMVKKIKKLGGELIHGEKLYKRNVYGLANDEVRGYSRVRSEYNDKGQTVTLTSKTYENKDFPLENEIETVDSFEQASKFMESLRLPHKAYHETTREKYTGVKGCNEITIDTIPGFNPYIEVDCISKEKFEETANTLGLDLKDAHYGAYGNLYGEIYGIDVKWFNDELEELKFETVREKLIDRISKNKEEFIKITDKYVNKAQELQSGG